MSDLYKEVIVCYDVQADKTRNQLAEALKDIGLIPIQKSVFWGFVTLAEERAVRQEFTRLLDEETDRAFVLGVNLQAKLASCGVGYNKTDLPPFTTHEAL